MSCSCEDKKSDKFGIPEDCKRTLESIWKRAIESCQSKSLKNFLMEQGKLSSLHVSQGTFDCIKTTTNNNHGRERIGTRINFINTFDLHWS